MTTQKHTQEEIGSKIKQLRIEKKMTQAELAEKMKVSEKQLFKKAGKGITMCEDAKKEMEQLIQEIRTMLEEDADIKRLFIRKTGAGPQVEIAGVGKVSLEEAEKLVGKDVRWKRC